MDFLTATGTFILFAFLLVGLVLILFGLPGTALMLLATFVYGWATGFAKVTAKILIILLIITVVAETLDFLAGMWGAKKYGSSNKAMAGALVGGVVGSALMAPIALGLGAIPGALIGSFGGAFLVAKLEKKRMGDAAWVGYGAFLGRAIGVILKGTAAVSMIVIDVFAIFF